VTERPDVRWTGRVLTGGTVLSAACFTVGFVLSLLGGEPEGADPRQLELVARSVLELQPWGWSMLGVLVLIGTPAAGLAVTFAEMRRLQPRSAALALVVLAILAAATLIAVATT
jgi:uncharacterized membrane protein